MRLWLSSAIAVRGLPHLSLRAFGAAQRIPFVFPALLRKGRALSPISLSSVPSLPVLHRSPGLLKLRKDLLQIPPVFFGYTTQPRQYHLASQFRAAGTP
jgi:hypothetical protein